MPFNKQNKAGSFPVWMTTFADLMALMLTFFVLLFSFSVIDAKKYKMIVESMAQGFGAQWIKRQNQNPGDAGPNPGILSPPLPDKSYRPQTEHPHDPLLQELKQSLAQELSNKSIELSADDGHITIIFPEKIAFPVGSEELREGFYQSIARLAAVLAKTRGEIEIIGHTDNVPIKTERFRSNWELSAARAVSVLHGITTFQHIDHKRFKVIGLADTQPLIPNTSAANRAKNRRVEIILLRPTS